VALVRPDGPRSVTFAEPVLGGAAQLAYLLLKSHACAGKIKAGQGQTLVLFRLILPMQTMLTQ
jgi:hypothetical protein